MNTRALAAWIGTALTAGAAWWLWSPAAAMFVVGVILTFDTLRADHRPTRPGDGS